MYLAFGALTEYYNYFSNSLIIHNEKTKEITTVTGVLDTGS